MERTPRSRWRLWFAQASALVVLLLTLGAAGTWTASVFDFASWAALRPVPAGRALAMIGVILGVVFVGLLATVLWGRVLVALGVLTSEEARGYPYSRPWAERREAPRDQGGRS